MNELFTRMIKPTAAEYESLPQVGLLLKKLAEVNDEFIKGDINAAVGGITDLIVISVNAIKIICDEVDYSQFYENKIHGLESKEYEDIIYKILLNIMRVLQRHHDEEYFDMIAISIKCIRLLVYSPELDLEETVKKIESGHKPDYSRARL